ncbi:MAG: S8 family serine peptidase [Chloroflexi bacterium]|nr:S8 family serine peptidase [Chloroflexota bacterium]
MRTTTRVLTLSFILLALFAGGTTQAAGPGRPARVAPAAWQATANGPADLLVVLTGQADLGPASRLPTKAEKGRFVYRTLTQVALRTQAPLRSWLAQRGVDYEPFYLVNALRLSADRALLISLAARSDVGRIELNPAVRGISPRVEPVAGAQAVTGVEWNVALIGAQAVWNTYGVRGEGIVVAGNDTGIEWTHPALKAHYRGWNGTTADHDRNWLDAISNSPTPLDDLNHGTHTMGTMVGDDGQGNQIGVAPGARWIGCRNMDLGVGTPASYLTCFQFFLAPYPHNGDPFADGDPSLAPHVINNSWVCPPSEGCSVGTLQSAVESLRAAGVVVVASAGNEGPLCSTVGDPPAIYDAAFSVGASNSSDQIAGFSSRGPVLADGSGRRKPDITAPGVNVRSSVRGGGYAGGWSGTSMAAPHVAGAVALLWSAAPALVGKVALTERILQITSHPHTTTQGCGGDASTAVPNNVWGWGRLDALQAVEVGLTCPSVGDFDGDGRVTIVDIMQVASAWGLHDGDPGYSSAYDLDGNQIIDESDIMAIVTHWQEACREL